MSKRRKSKGKQINPTYWVFCEGETEKEYVSFLRTKFPQNPSSNMFILIEELESVKKK